MFTTFGLVVFYRICFWKASGSREPLGLIDMFTSHPKPLPLKREGLGCFARFFYAVKNYDCSRGVAELSASYV